MCHEILVILNGARWKGNASQRHENKMGMNRGRRVEKENVCDTRKSRAANEVDARRRDATCEHVFIRFTESSESGHSQVYAKKDNEKGKCGTTQDPFL